MAGYLRRLCGVGAAIKEVVDRGLLGRLISAEARWVTTSVARRDPTSVIFSATRSGGGVLHWECCHWLDMMRWATGAEAVEVSSIGDTLSGQPIDVEDVAAVALRVLEILDAAAESRRTGRRVSPVRGSNRLARP
jgi:predicted dehydrogenase